MPDDSLHGLLEELLSVYLHFFPGSDARKKALLGKLSLENGFNAGRLRQYHDALIGLLAYPENRDLYREARSEMDRIVKLAGEHLGRSSWQLALAGSGIPGTRLIASFSYDCCRWLDEQFPGQVELESSQADPETVRLFFRSLLPRMEYETVSAGDWDLVARIRKLRGKSNGNSLHWLLLQLERSELDGPAREALFNSLQAYVAWTTHDPVYNRSYGTDGISAIVPFKPGKKTSPPRRLLSRPLPDAHPLDASQREHLVHLARCTLGWLYRETEPFTYADHRETTYYRLENGLSVALFGMQPERQLSLESYIGYLAFRNGIPVAYGGGWLFGSRCQFGINILPPFRGADSMGLFYQLLRVYHRRYGAQRFVVKPYQFGWHNPEALKSGAFWFYYKAGFRPVSATIYQLAEEEAMRKRQVPGYRSSLPVLKKFTGSDLFLELDASAVPKQDAAVISRCLTDFINAQYGGDRQRALSECTRALRKRWGREWPSPRGEREKRALAEWSLLAHAMLKPEQWKAAERRQWIKAILLKLHGNETDYIHALRAAAAFWRDTREMLC